MEETKRDEQRTFARIVKLDDCIEIIFGNGTTLRWKRIRFKVRIIVTKDARELDRSQSEFFLPTISSHFLIRRNSNIPIYQHPNTKTVVV